MRSEIEKATSIFAFIGNVLLALCLTTQAWAAPEYVTAWPKQVPVEKPDPVTGDKPTWEFWVYSEAFAKRFKGFPIDKADKELSGGMRAMVLRIYKRNLWSEVTPNYPEQYACEVDVYFDNSTALRISESGKPRHIFPTYPAAITESYKRLDPVDEKDVQAMRASKPARFNMKAQPLVFADPLDGRYANFGVREYHPNLAPSLSYIGLLSSFSCELTAPLKEKGSHWLSLQGERPYSRDKDGNDPTLWGAVHGTYRPGIKSTFDPGPDPESKGYFRVPEAFNKAALPKVTLIKVMNWCIGQRHSHAHPVGKPMSPESWEPIAYTCDEVEHHGRILPDPRYYSGKEGLQDTGY